MHFELFIGGWLRMFPILPAYSQILVRNAKNAQNSFDDPEE
jgi:hypothetical protein